MTSWQRLGAATSTAVDGEGEKRLVLWTWRQVLLEGGLSATSEGNCSPWKLEVRLRNGVGEKIGEVDEKLDDGKEEEVGEGCGELGNGEEDGEWFEYLERFGIDSDDSNASGLLEAAMSGYER